jgi:hypothetical protein
MFKASQKKSQTYFKMYENSQHLNFNQKEEIKNLNDIIKGEKKIARKKWLIGLLEGIGIGAVICFGLSL